MNHRLACAMLVAVAWAVVGSGCCCLDRYYHGECDSAVWSGRHAAGGCATGSCTSGACGDGDCAAGACGTGTCGTATCGTGRCINPFRMIFHAIHCSSGCGEFYFDEWLNDPPDACDPCDDYGGYIGRRPCPPRWWLGGRKLHGYRCSATCDTACGYRGGNCGAGCTSCGHAPASLGGDEAEIVPTPEPMFDDEIPTQARRSQPYYQPTPATRRASYVEPQAKSYSTATRHTRLVTPATALAPIGTGVPR